MSYGRAMQVTRILGLVLTGIYAVAAIVGLVADLTSGQTVAWVVFLGGGALLIFLGQNLSKFPPVIAAALICVGAVAGAFPLIPFIVPPVAAAVLVWLTISLARRPAPAQ
jgi:threonine/homoserine/homoserine lactone efflux protein